VAVSLTAGAWLLAIKARRAAISACMSMIALEAVVSHSDGTKACRKAAAEALNSRPLKVSANSICSKKPSPTFSG